MDYADLSEKTLEKRRPDSRDRAHGLPINFLSQKKIVTEGKETKSTLVEDLKIQSNNCVNEDKSLVLSQKPYFQENSFQRSIYEKHRRFLEGCEPNRKIKGLLDMATMFMNRQRNKSMHHEMMNNGIINHFKKRQNKLIESCQTSTDSKMASNDFQSNSKQ